MLKNLLLKARITPIKLGPPLKDLPNLDIAHITATSFYRQARKRENVSFCTSLYELDRLIEDKSTQDDKATLKEIQAKLPLCYYSYKDVFLKAASNILPLHRLYNY